MNAAQDSANAAKRALPKRILVADDSRDSAETMSMLLQMSGHEVHVAHSGAEAFEIAKSVRPDIGIFDIGMPDMNGTTWRRVSAVRPGAAGSN